jgi:type II secretory pathway pseudopilin PulG
MRYKPQSGFTLIETLIYLGLYAIIIGGAVVSTYALFESTARNETTAIVEQEGDYLTAKIDTVFRTAMSVSTPSVSGPRLSVVTPDGSSIVLQSIGNNLVIQRGSGPSIVLNNTRTRVTHLAFTHTHPTSDGVNPESISVVFTLSASTTDGHILSRDFSTTYFLRI